MKHWVWGMMLLFFLLAGCGNKGPLYLPEPDEKREQSE